LTLRRFAFREGNRHSSCWQNPPNVYRGNFAQYEKCWTKRPRFAFWGRASRKPPGIAIKFFMLEAQAPPLGFAPLQGLFVKALAGFRQPPSHVLYNQTDCSAWKPAPQSIHQLSPKPCRHHDMKTVKAALLRFLHLPDPMHSGLPCPGYVFTFRRRHYITAALLTISGH
jgi:hypothetical protein